MTSLQLRGFGQALSGPRSGGRKCLPQPPSAPTDPSPSGRPSPAHSCHHSRARSAFSPRRGYVAAKAVLDIAAVVGTDDAVLSAISEAAWSAVAACVGAVAVAAASAGTQEAAWIAGRERRAALAQHNQQLASSARLSASAATSAPSLSLLPKPLHEAQPQQSQQQPRPQQQQERKAAPGSQDLARQVPLFKQIPGKARANARPLSAGPLHGGSPQPLKPSSSGVGGGAGSDAADRLSRACKAAARAPGVGQVEVSAIELASELCALDLHHFTAKQLCTSYFALATAHYIPRNQLHVRILELLLQHDGAVLRAAAAHDVSRVVYALALRQHRHAPDVVTVLRVAQTKLAASTPQDLALVAWALVTLREGSPAARTVEPRFIDALLQASQPQLRGFTPQGLSNLLWALAKLGHCPPASFTEALVWHAVPLMGNLKPQELSNLLWALAMLDCSVPAAFLTALCDAAPSLLYAFTLQELSNTAWALAKLGVRASRDRTGPALPLAELVVHGSGVPELEALRPRLQQLLDDLFAAAAARLPSFNVQQLANTAWAYTELKHHHLGLWLALQQRL